MNPERPFSPIKQEMVPSPIPKDPINELEWLKRRKRVILRELDEVIIRIENLERSAEEVEIVRWLK